MTQQKVIVEATQFSPQVRLRFHSRNQFDAQVDGWRRVTDTYIKRTVEKSYNCGMSGVFLTRIFIQKTIKLWRQRQANLMVA